MSSIKRNFIYNLGYQIFSLIIPFITTPYISRILGSVGVGQYAYTFAIVSYFVLAGSLGFGYYAQREIASSQQDKCEQSKLFWEIVLARGISVLFFTTIFVVLLMSGYFGEYTSLLAIWAITLISSAFDISFYFQGCENFGQLALRNFLIRIIGIALIFIFVKEKEDVSIYVIVQSVITVLSNLFLWPLLSKMLVKVPLRILQIKRHFRPALRLFIPTLAVSVYTIFDKILIGILVTGTIVTTMDNGDVITANLADVENGYYEQAEKIVKLVLTIFLSLSVVMVTRNSDEFSRGNKEVFLGNIYSTARFLWFLGCPLVFGLIGIASNFSPWFFGEGFDKVPNLISLFAPLILIIGLSNILGRQYLIPRKQDSIFTKSIVIGAVINIFLNILLIKKFYSFGSAVSTVIAEMIIVLIMLYHVRNDLSIKKLFAGVKRYFIVSVGMYIVIKLISIWLEPSPLSTIILIIIGCFLYGGILIVFQDYYLLSQLKQILNKVK